jgi:hypothetical protein
MIPQDLTCDICHKVLRKFFISDASPYVEILVESTSPAIWEADEANWPNGVRAEAPILLETSKVSHRRVKLTLWRVSTTNHPT